ncbi:MAG: TlyA family RNA methyltransferase [Acidobacteriota bacterium]|nr:TlyA family RNA methyltransferase [Acidobacteriota bacterium]
MSAADPPSRLDLALVSAGLAPSREKAQALILAGRVLVDGRPGTKAGQKIPAGATLTLKPGRLYASRAGAKLAGVLDPLAVEPRGLRCLDVGASTGGFTDVLLQRGAVHVTAVDVGKGLIDQRLREDPRVRVVEGVNARYLTPAMVEAPYDLVTADLSFISLTLVLDALLPLAPEGRLLAMVKPQFEVGRERVGPKGVVRDPATRAAAVEKVIRCLAARDWGILGLRASPVTGPKGNREVFVLTAAGPGLPPEALAGKIQEEVRRAPD